MKITAALDTLGCKVNQYESSHFLEQLKGTGFQIVPFGSKADLYLVHSCCVTAKAAYQTRQLLRRAKRNNPGALIVVLGCGAQLESDRFARERLATHILGTVEKINFLEWLKKPGSFASPCIAATDPRNHRQMEVLMVNRMHSERARAFLKVQDGCDAFCSYCVVPYTRGKSRSLAIHHVRSQFDRFASQGYREVVITGIHLGQWGRDLSATTELTQLLRALPTGSDAPRIRLSSLEPREWNDGLLHFLGTTNGICPHFHVPLQSGDKEILSRMHRPYSPDEYRQIVQKLRDLFPNAALGADVMVGFPGETECQFMNTVRLIEEVPVNYLHVFPYSPRPETAAAEQPGRLSKEELKRRSKVLRALGNHKKRIFQQSFIKKWVEVIAETNLTQGIWRGTSENYLTVTFSAKKSLPPGTLARVRITELNENGLLGTLDSIL